MPAPAVPGIAIVLAMVGFSGAARAAPARCDLPVTVTPSTLPAGIDLARVRIPARSPDIQFRASSGAAGLPVNKGAGAMGAELTVEPPYPPLVIVAAVGGGFCGFSVVRLGSARHAAVAPGPVTLVVIEPPTAPGDADAEVWAYVFALDEHGAPRRGDGPAFRPGAGALSVVERLGPGVWRGRWNVPVGKADETPLEVTFGSEEPAWGFLARKAGRPAALEIEEDPASNVNGVPGALILRIRDSAGNLTDGDLTLESDATTVGVPVRVERGIYRAPLVVPPETWGKSFDVIAIANPSRIFASVTLVSGSPPPAVVTVVSPGPILAYGSSLGRPTNLPVTVADASGNPVNDVPVGSAELGRFFEALAVGSGSWELPYRTPRVLEDSVDHIIVRAGTVSTHADLQLKAGRFSGAVGLKAGMVVAGSVGPGIGLEGSAWAIVGRTQLGLTLDLSWWTLTQTSATTVGGTTSTYTARQNYLPVQLCFSWRMPYARRWVLWASAGGGVAIVWNHPQVSGQPSVSESGAAPAASASISTGPRLGPGSAFLELRVTWIGDPKLSTLTGSTVNFLLLLGYRFDV